ncbi:MAG: cache domain-containing protein [bacterium]|jgi:two-component system NtrC family sensor kinase
MEWSLRKKILLVFVVIIAINGLITLWVGFHLIGDRIVRRAQDDVRTDLNSAREVYTTAAERMHDVVRLTAVRFFLREAVLNGRTASLSAELQRIRTGEALDVLTLTDSEGTVLFRSANPGMAGDSQAGDPVVARVLEEGESIVATVITGHEDLEKESEALAALASIRPVPTPMSEPRSDSLIAGGMLIKSAAPVLDADGTLIGVLYGARMLNQRYEIVDAVKDIVYRGEKYGEKDAGTATIFQNDLRIATNVMGPDGRRAVGTRVSAEVYDRVIGMGLPWVGRAFVVNDWYITAYEPIRSLDGDVIGMLYVGTLEAPYTALRRNVILTFAGIAAAAIAAMSIAAVVLSGRIARPIRELVRGTEKIAAGRLSYRVGVESGDEVGQLAASFNRMAEELQRARDGYDELLSTLEEKVRDKTRELQETHDRLVQSEKLTSMGRMAAGIAHEINNPLTSILINSHLAAEHLGSDPEAEESLSLIMSETARCSEIVGGLLDFSRQNPPEMVIGSLNDVVEKTLALLRTQLLAARVDVVRELDGSIPLIPMDANKMEQAFANLVLNAIDAMPDGGSLRVESGVSADGGGVLVVFADTGCGISEEDLTRVFDPFFSTKGTAGTGLGLSVTYGIIEQHGGRIDVNSRIGEGAVFIVSIPLAQGGRPENRPD